MIREEWANAVHGCGALMEMLDWIGVEETTDHDLAKLLMDNEHRLEALLKFALDRLAQDI
jgi:hypothetical protein